MEFFLNTAAVGSLVIGLGDLGVLVIQKWDRPTLGRVVGVTSAVVLSAAILLAIGVRPTLISLAAGVGALTHLAVLIVFIIFCQKR